MDLNKSNNSFDAQDIESNKLLAVISYLSILSIVTLIVAPNSKYARYHANQGICLLVAEVVFGIVRNIAAILLGFIPIIGWIVIMIFNLASIIFLVLSILGIVNAAKGEAKPLPIIGGFQLVK